jgi:DNA-binding PadR family transcriptional regulator
MPALKTSSFLVLGLIRGGVGSGYAIRQTIEQMRMSAFWATSFAQIYPELAQLEQDGYIVGYEDPQGARPRTAYTLTEKGEGAFLAWLTEADLPPTEVRDEGIMRLGFGDHLPREQGLALLGRLRERAEDAEREFREEVLLIAEAAGTAAYASPRSSPAWERSTTLGPPASTPRSRRNSERRKTTDIVGEAPCRPPSPLPLI